MNGTNWTAKLNPEQSQRLKSARGETTHETLARVRRERDELREKLETERNRYVHTVLFFVELRRVLLRSEELRDAHVFDESVTTKELMKISAILDKRHGC